MTNSTNFLTKYWEESHVNKDNFVMYPKEEVVKFINRFIRKKTGFSTFKDVISFENTVKALDYGCGIGRQTILLKEFGMDPIGIDISEEAINTAKTLALDLGFNDLNDNFLVTDTTEIPFPDHHFNVSICESVLDSMHFDIAQRIMDELGRVTTDYIFFSVISGRTGDRPIEYAAEETVETTHEFGTIQSYFNWNKVLELIENINFEVVFSRLITEEGVNERFRYGRYNIVLKRKNQ